MKYTLAITQQCNLACKYCYITKDQKVMSPEIASCIVDFIFQRTPPEDNIDIGFFGGEPLLEFGLIEKIVAMVTGHQLYDSKRVLFSTVTNGTIFSDELAEKLKKDHITLGISCDGPPRLQDFSRVFPDGTATSAIVEENIRRALRFFPFMPVNAVYRPETLHSLPEVIDYFAGLGVRNIYLNHDISARWSKADVDQLHGIYETIGRKYIDFYRAGEPRHISLIDSKIVVLLRGGYHPMEKCRMGKGEFAFAPSGNVYPCERLIGSDDGEAHCLGNIAMGGEMLAGCRHDAEYAVNEVCRTCGLRDYCMNWCGCTNFFATGDYNTAGPFLCGSEKAAIQTAHGILEQLGREGFAFSDHLAGTPLLSILGEVGVLSAQ
ncbi:MAG: 4Fe-4S cluster-binding domain-containing protein [Chlorobiaceae bacterium]|jgi:uncharacterized protein|nr:4Fe-4S cluster-binding domain-containing protein [Chlorobiaceae bacterium]